MSKRLACPECAPHVIHDQDALQDVLAEVLQFLLSIGIYIYICIYVSLKRLYFL